MSTLSTDQNPPSLNHLACPQCDKDVDDTAPACPNCGYKIYVEHSGDITPVRHITNTGDIDVTRENNK